ncbi:uncharacterized protein LOC128204639 [Mya arenaria]|uniref:uncharacterized protein LOC128204639 n=1 Tax=Mya arenaria TaxID=6604 RepID=UPI0022E49DCA|nr:uncharacterized protein LOC128204639 [Mya arenaria]
MAEARSSADEEKEFFSRVTLALTDCGTKLLLHLLIRRIQELTPKDHPRQPWSLDEFLYNNVKDILISIGKDKMKRNILYPGFQKETDLSKWDIPLYVFVLLNACELDDTDYIRSQLRHDICNIRNIRNKMQHMGNPRLKEAIYRSYIGRIVGAVERICDYIQKPKMKISLLKDIEKYSSLRHLFQTGVISETGCKSVDIINESDAAVESGLQEMMTIIEKKRLSVNIPVIDVMVMFRNYNKEDEQAITERLLEIFSQSLENGTALPADRSSNELDVVVKSLVRKLVDEKKEITKISRGCLVLSIRCHDLDAVISLIQDSLSGKLESIFEPLEELMRTDAYHELFEVCVGITKQSCWALFYEMFCEVSDQCDQRRFTVESTVQNDGIVVRIQGFLQNAIVKENLEKSFSSKVKKEVCKTINEYLASDLDQPGMDMILLSPKLHEEMEDMTIGSASKHTTSGLKKKEKTKDVSHIPFVTKPDKTRGFGVWQRPKTPDRMDSKEKKRPSLMKIKEQDNEKTQAVVDLSNCEPGLSELKEERLVATNTVTTDKKKRDETSCASSTDTYNKGYTVVQNADNDPILQHKGKMGNMELLDKNGKGEYGSIFGLTIVNDKYLVAADNWKLCLRCFDIDNRKQEYMYEIKLEPWDITTIPELKLTKDVMELHPVVIT